MKTWTTLAAIALCLATYSLHAQEDTPPKGEKRVIITKRIVEPDGTERIETIIKKGAAAEAFDIGQYRREQGADSIHIHVQVIDNPLQQLREQLESIEWEAIGRELDAGLKTVSIELERVFDPETGEVGRVLRELECTPRQQTQGYLGVSPRGNDDPDTQGVPVDVLPNTAAERAGLQSGDVLLSINNTPLHYWDELERFVAKTKPGQRVTVSYQRGKKAFTTEVVLDSKIVRKRPEDHSRARAPEAEGPLRQKEACLGVYTVAQIKSQSDVAQPGAVVSSFTERSAAREAGMQAGDLITAINTTPVRDYDQLWNAIARYRPGDRVMVYYQRNGDARQVEVTLKACRDQSTLLQPSGRKRSPIALRRASEGDIPQVSPLPEATPERQLALEGFRAYPNPTTGIITVEFRTSPQPTVVALLDLSGRQLFREELNAFHGQYSQQFDLSEFPKGTLLLVVQQGERLFTERIVLH